MSGLWGLLCLIIGVGVMIWAGRSALLGQDGWMVWLLLGLACSVLGALAGQPWIGEDEEE